MFNEFSLNVITKKKLKNNLASRDGFHFKHVNPDDVYSVIHSVNANKATGYDMMPPRLVKISAHY